MKGIRTFYAGVNFRSRLEAKWAYMFDAFGWAWHYEPFELDGYIPDFSLDFKRPTIAEVKPLIDDGVLALAKGKIDKSGWPGEAMIVSHTVDQWPDCPSSSDGHGAFLDLSWDSQEPIWEHYQFFRCRICHKVGVCSLSGGYTCRVCGAYDGDHHMDGLDGFLQDKWLEAGNLFQWRAA